jgi:hypothetical protein
MKNKQKEWHAATKPLKILIYVSGSYLDIFVDRLSFMKY